MGEIRATAELFNYVEGERAAEGAVPQDTVARVSLDMLVDTGSVMVLLPQEVIERLRLRHWEKHVAVLADDRKVSLRRFHGLGLKVCGRMGLFECLEGPPNCEALLGQVVLEVLDLIPDPVKKALTVRPESPFIPVVKLK